MRTLIAGAMAATLVAPMACAEGGSTVEEAAASINEEDYIRKVAVIADDSMMGRDTPSEGLEMTARWIANEFDRYGLEPGGDDGSYIQRWPYPAYGQDWDATEVTVEGGPELALGENLAWTGSLAQGELSAELVVLGGSVPGVESMDRRAQAQAVRDALEGIDVEGKHVLLVSPQASLMGRGLQGVASRFVVSDLEGEEWQAFVEEQRQDVSRVYGSEPPEFNGTPAFAIRGDAAMALLESANVQAPGDEGALQVRPTGLTVTVDAAARQVDDEMPPNVVGVLPGSDPELADEYVIFSAHMDHVGVGSPREDSVFDASGQFVRMEQDSIYNGADDDASGTIAVVEVAEAFSMLAEPPRRSMVFLLVSGEEKGLLGSRYYANNPTVPAESIVANFNTDMIGRNWEDTVVVIGKEHSELGEIMNRVGAEHPELDMAPIDDRWPEQNFYRRSDHFNFARRGIPVLFFFTGTHEDYHQSTDEVRKLGGDKSARISKLVFYLSHEVANMDEPPMWYDDSYDEYVSDAPEGAPRRSRPRDPM